jgi:hypothetical protein
MEMLGGVLVFRGIAAAHVAAGQAQAQVYPGVAHLQAFLAAARVRLDVVNLIGMRASVQNFHGFPPPNQSILYQYQH